MSICCASGCPKIATDHGRCAPHRRLVTGTGSRPSVKNRAQILKRDGNRCTWIENGKRCTATTGLEVDHVVAVRDGGGDEAENCRVLCHHHHVLRHRGGLSAATR